MSWSDGKRRNCMEGNVKLGEGKFQHTKAQLARLPRQRKVETANARFLAATAEVRPGEEARGWEASVSDRGCEDV